MTAKQAKELADSQAIDVREVYQKIEDNAKKGEYYCMWYEGLSPDVAATLTLDGYVVKRTNVDGVLGFKISWE